MLLTMLAAAWLPGGMAGLAAISEWPQWRGPWRTGETSGPFAGERLDEASLRQSWRVELGPGYSGPVVGGGRVFVTETQERKFELVRALDCSTGKELWRAQWEGAMSVPFFAKANGDWIRSTPALADGRLYVAGMRDVLVCLDAATGKELWRFDFPKELNSPLPDFGFVCSPLVEDGAVFAQAGAGLVKLDAATGKLLWRVLGDQGGMWGSAFSSPVISTVAGRRQLLVQTRTMLAGVAPDDGTVWWRQPVEAFRGMNILTPVVWSNQVFTSTYGGKTIAFAVQHAGGQFTVAPAWTHKAQGYMSTPVVIDGVAFHHLRSERMTAMELATGRELWVTSESFGKYASLVHDNKRILMLDQRGTLHLLRANREKFERLDSRKVSEAETWAHLAVAGRQVFVRDLKGLTVFEWLEQAPKASSTGDAR